MFHLLGSGKYSPESLSVRGPVLAVSIPTVRMKRKEKFTLFSDHNGSLLRRQPGAPTVMYVAVTQIRPNNFAPNSAALLMHSSTLHTCNHVNGIKLCCMQLFQQPNITQSISMLMHSLSFCSS